MWFGNNHRNYNFEILVLNAFKEKKYKIYAKTVPYTKLDS